MFIHCNIKKPTLNFYNNTRNKNNVIQKQNFISIYNSLLALETKASQMASGMYCCRNVTYQTSQG